MAKKILIVDDDQDQVNSLAHVLKSKGYDIAEAYNGVTVPEKTGRGKA